MNLVSTNQQTMTLKEITDLLEVRHNDAMRVVERMMEDKEFGSCTKISYLIEAGKGATRNGETYQLNKRQSIAVASRLNTALLMRVIDRWMELEEKASFSLPKTYSEALYALAKKVEEAEEAKRQIEVLLPKAEVFGNVVADLKTPITDYIRKYDGVNSMAIKKDLP